MVDHDDRIRIDIRITPVELREQLRDDVRRGLAEQPKRLAAKWHYDETGSRLFDEITRQPEYYPTGREREILTARVDEIAQLSRAETLIELGSGTGEICCCWVPTWSSPGHAWKPPTTTPPGSARASRSTCWQC